MIPVGTTCELINVQDVHMKYCVPRCNMCDVYQRHYELQSWAADLRMTFPEYEDTVTVRLTFMGRLYPSTQDTS